VRRSSIATGVTVRVAPRVAFATQPRDEPWDRLKGWRVADAVIKAYEHAPVER
jgi:hypothetical protein